MNISRRDFITKGLGGLALASTLGTIKSKASSNPSDTVVLGFIGVGTQGHRHLREVLNISGVKVKAICDLYTGHIDRALKIVGDPKLKVYKDYRELLDDKDINAVVIATPDFWHSKQTCDAANAGKDVYVEKCMTHTIPEAKEIVKAIKENKRILQLGHQGRSHPLNWRAKEIVDSGILGKITVIRITMYRNSDSGGWRFYGDYSILTKPPDADPQHIDWDRFLENAPKRPFSERRFFHWRCYWDYGTGLSGDLISHKFDDANQIVGLGIPSTCVASGGIYYWNDDREVPDTWHVLYEYPEKGIAVVGGTMFTNMYYGEKVEIMCKDGTIDLGGNGLNVYLEPTNEKYKEKLNKIAEKKRERGESVSSINNIPVYTYKGDEEIYSLNRMAVHMQNFIDCVRTRKRTRCNEDDGFEEAVTCIMPIIAFKEKREVKWDPVKQEVV